ncbi:MAG: NAD(+) diphosphatase [Longimicrobiales bacterium]
MNRIVFIGRRPVLDVERQSPRMPSANQLERILGVDRLEMSRVDLTLSDSDGVSVHVHILEESALEEVEASGLQAVPLRTAWRQLDAEDFRLLGTARQKADWVLTHRFCSRCAAATTLDPHTDGLRCTKCSQIHYPRIAPAVIVLVQRGREALLGRSPRFPAGVYSTLAGFVEPGETLEECVHREVEEESGVRVHNLRYFGSQSHPFPHSLMVGFVADWLDGELRIDPTELADAQWFDVDELPRRPHPRSIAFRLIADFEQRVRSEPVSR